MPAVQILSAPICLAAFLMMVTMFHVSIVSFTGVKLNVSHLFRISRFELMLHDVAFPLYVEVDQIYNLACPASPIHYEHASVQTIKTRVHGAIHMLGLPMRLKAIIFQPFTSEVYGDTEVHLHSESCWGRVNPIGPRSCYDEGQYCAETLFSLTVPAQYGY